ncbi:MAG TPA: glycine C-acetyltransferase [candidate division Zixibacteria bacterium]|nr:glycine C-acetyltransferase [candidate division Zixibacteria bacterium]
MRNWIVAELQSIKDAGLWKEERIITSPQDAVVTLADGRKVINFCANNYLGLANHPKVKEAAKKALEKYSYGMASVRFICGTLDIHKELERKLADFLGMDDAILYVACFDANGGLFEPFFNSEDAAIITDELNHASIIDGIRLAKKAMRLIYKHSDMADLEEKLKQAQDKKYKIIVTDGVFSMDGDMAKLDEIVPLAEKYGSLVMVDDSHATGFIGKTGRGTFEHFGVKVDIITSTLGKALGGANGGFTAGPQEFIDMLRQRSRPYLFSNTLAPSIVAASIAVLDMLSETTELRDRLEENTKYFRRGIEQLGLDVKPGEHPITPIMLYDGKLANDFARDLLDEGIYVVGFSYPVVPKGQARIRVQVSAAHTKEHLDKALAAFEKVGKKYGLI